jgi:membrane fusion protein (multidrug efflux system)
VRCRPTLALAAAALLASACREEIPAAGAAAAPADPSVEVEVVDVRRASVPQHVSAPGSLFARRESQIGPEVVGRIERVLVAEGDRVEAGDPLFRIDPEPYTLALRQGEAGLDLVRAERIRTEADLGRALALRERGVLASQEVERLGTALAVAQARERQAAEAVALARRDLERTVVRAPYAGSVTERLADEGTLAQPHTVVLVLQETAELEARAGIPESQLAVVSAGDPALLHVEGLPEPVRTTVAAVGDSVDPATRTYLVRMRVPNPAHRLKAGVFASVEIGPSPKTDVLVVPREAIRTEDGRARVLAVREGRAVAVPVELGIVSEEVAEVVSGLAEGEAVVVGESAATLAPGMRVRVARNGPAS